MTAATAGRPAAEHPCVGCGRTDTRLYAEGWRCPDHTPAKRRGQPEPDLKRACAPLRCYCGDSACPAIYGLPTPVAETVVDERAVASGKRRSNLTDYREAQARRAERTSA